MRYIPILIALIGLVALAATLWIFFTTTTLEPIPGEPIDPARNRPDAPFIEDRIQGSNSSERVDVDPSGDVGSGREEVEKILPIERSGLYPGDLLIHVASLEDKRPLSPDALMQMKLYYNDVEVHMKPAPDQAPGDYRLSRAMPGRYRVKVVTQAWEMGETECMLKPGSVTETWVWIASPRVLQVQVVDGDSGKPVSNVRLDAMNFIQGGITDEKGLFKSARKFTPVQDMVVQLSHPRYCTLRFHPLHPGQSGVETIGQGSTFRVRLAPRNGDLILGGKVMDEQGLPLSRWALMLMPRSPGKKNRGFITTYTDQDGQFRFTQLKPGTYQLVGTLRLLMTSYLQNPTPVFEEQFIMTPGVHRKEELVICNRIQRTFTGRVFQADSHAPAAGVEVSYRRNMRDLNTGNSDPLFFKPMTTGADGSFSTTKTFLPEDIFRMLLNGSIQLNISGGESIPYRLMQSSASLRRFQDDILQGHPILLWLSESMDVELTGQVTDAHGRPLPHVRITAETATGSMKGRYQSMTDKDGLYKITHLSSGTWRIQAAVHQGPTVQRALTIPRDRKKSELDIRLEGDCILKGSLYFPEPPKRATLYLHGMNYEATHRISGPQFSFELVHLPPGKALVIVEVFQGNRYQESNLIVQEAWVVLEAGKACPLDFNF